MKRMFICLGIMFLVGACALNNVSPEDEKATFSLDVNTDPLFVKSRSVNMADYLNIDNYMIELAKDGTIIESVKYGDMALTKELEPGSYFIRAFYGEDVSVGYDKLYVEGSLNFNLGKGDNRLVEFTCVPSNVKVNIKFEDNFFEFYSDCKVSLKTKHLTEAFVMVPADAAKDAFFKADAAGEVMTIGFELKDKQGVVVTPENFGIQTVTIKPRDFLTITIKPRLINVDGGKIDGITVTIDGSVVIEDIPIEIPDEYLPGIDSEVGN